MKKEDLVMKMKKIEQNNQKQIAQIEQPKMNKQSKINVNWSDYDSKKNTEDRDEKFISSDEKWEIDSLVKQYQKRFPCRTETQIVNAIASCCLTVSGPISREKIVKCLVSKL